jgi:hypothetical protein
MLRLVRLLFAVLFIAFAALSPDAEAQSTASEVFDLMVSAHEGRMQGINNYTVVSDAFTAHYRRTGGDRFEVGTEVSNVRMGNMTSGFGTEDPRTLRELYGAGAQLTGATDMDGAAVFVIELTPPPGGDAQRMTLFVDQELLVVRGIDVDSNQPGQGLEIRFEDFRETESLLNPWLSRVTVLGAGMTPTELAEANTALEQMEVRIEQMPAAQQAMLQPRLEEMRERIDAMANGGGMNATYVVSEVRVNQGVPASAF